MPIDQEVHAHRRAALRARMAEEGGGVLLVPAAEEKARNGDNTHDFRQDSDFAWLTGLDEPTGCALLFTGPAPRSDPPPPASPAVSVTPAAVPAPPASGAALPAASIVTPAAPTAAPVAQPVDPAASSTVPAAPPADAAAPSTAPGAHAAGPAAPALSASATAPPATPGFVLLLRPRDPKHEQWTGARTGVEGAREVYGATEAFPAGEVDSRLAALLDGVPTLFYRLGADAGWDARVAAALRSLRERERRGADAPSRIVDAGLLLHEARLVKGPEELALLRRAAALTAEGHRAAMREGRAGRRELEVQAAIEHAFRSGGGTGPGFGTIVAAGAHATVLHHRAGAGELREGELCLVDAGAELDWYTGDVSRTFPVSGRFSPVQREVYEVVLEAELAGIAATRPGTTLDAVHALVVRHLVEGLLRLGALAGSAEERIADRSYERYYMHRTSHWLGMDVHDVGRYRVGGAPRPLVPRMVLTMEPGLYFPAGDLSLPERLRGLGVRIEDDLAVTADGCENLTAAVPKTVAEVEAACAR